MLAPTKRPKDVEKEVGGQKLVDAEAGDQRPADAESQGSEDEKGPESKSRGPRLAGLGPELEDK